MKEAFTTTARFYFDPATRIMKAAIVENARITVQDVINHNRVMQRLADGTAFAVLGSADVPYTMTGEARAKSAGLSGNRIATAIVSTGFYNRLIANLYMQFNKPLCPTKLFFTEEEALTWLKEMISEHDKKVR